MKKITCTLVTIAFAAVSFAQVRMPQPSPTQSIKQDFGLSSIELTYSRPSVKGRQMIGNVEPWDAVWRTGANAATVIRFNDPVEVLGQKVDSGSYAIYTIPHKDGSWSFILNKGINNWGADGYKESDDVLRKKISASKNAMPVESLTMQFSDLKPESCVLNIRWENFGLKVPITVDIKDKLRSQFEAALQSDKKPYWQASQFYADWDNNKVKALELMNLAIAEQKTAPFYMLYYKAKLQHETGDDKSALITAQKSLELSKEAKNNAYIMMNEKLIQSLKK